MEGEGNASILASLRSVEENEIVCEGRAHGTWTSSISGAMRC